jgi:(heptosyl)LPS beta-1,4-glucosyltransferase
MSFMEKKLSITAVIIAKNESAMISNCIDSLRWCDHILVIDNGSTDDTVTLAENAGARVINHKSDDFSQTRNVALKYVKTDWLLYVDADERVTPRLYQEIAVNIETNAADVLQFHRQNICYGSAFEHGGWQHDLVTRCFKRSALVEWTGSIHESPKYEGQVKLLHTPLIHFTHRSTQDNLRKSAEWTIKEAALLAAAKPEKITLMTLARKGLMEFFRRAVLQQGYKDGMPGLIEAVVQGMNRVMVYIQVWELTQVPTIEEKYQQKELEIASQWKQL